MEELGRAHAPRARMLAIDRLLHAIHQQLRHTGRVLGRPAAANVLEGNYRDTLAFLDALTYGPASTPGLAENREMWGRTRAEQAAAQSERATRGTQAG